MGIVSNSCAGARAGAAAAGAERRRAPRWSTKLPGQIEIEGSRIAIRCLILDMSARGARIELSQVCARVRSAADLPECVVLALPVDKVGVTGAVRWRSGKWFGIEFASAFKPRSAVGLA